MNDTPRDPMPALPESVDLRKLVSRAINAAYSHGSDDEKEYKSDAYYRKAQDRSDAARAELLAGIEALESRVTAPPLRGG